MSKEMTSFIHALPKADLHLHLEGAVTPRILQLLAERHKVDLQAPVILPGKTPFCPAKGTGAEQLPFRTFPEFIGYYLKISQTIRTAEDVTAIATAYAESATEQGISYSEIYFSPSTFVTLEHDVSSLFQGLKEAQKITREDYQHTVRWIFDIVRNVSQNGQEVIELACSAREQGVDVAAIGIGGYEAVAPAPPFAEAFERARSLGFTTLAHSGETAGANSVKETLEFLKPSRIGHGFRVLEDAALVDELIEQQIPIEVCPWSNIALGLQTREDHPIARMIDSGLNVIICSDDPGIFGKTLTDNYLLAAELGVSREKLEEIAAKSLELRSRA